MKACRHVPAFRRFVNMTPAEIRRWARSPRSKLASFAATRRRLPAVATLRAKPADRWTPDDCRFAGRIVNFTSRMCGMARVWGRTLKIDVALRNWGNRSCS